MELNETLMLESDFISNANNMTGAGDLRVLAMSFMMFKIGRSNGILTFDSL